MEAYYQARHRARALTGSFRVAAVAPLILAVVSGLLVAGAFPPLGCWPLALVALVPLYFAIEGRRHVHATLLGWLSGSTAAACALFWIPSVMARFTGWPAVLTLGLGAILISWMGVRYALLAWAFVGACRAGFPPWLAFWLAHGASEAVLPLPFPWHLGAALHDQPLPLQVADLAGPIAVSGLVVSVNLAVVSLVRRLRGDAATRLGLVVNGSLMLLALVYGIVRERQIDAVVRGATKAQVGIVQANIPSELKQQIAAHVERQIALSRALLEQGPIDLLVWSETSAGAEREGFAAQSFERLFARRLRVPMLFGATLKNDGTSFNSVLLSEGGSICPRCRYDKQVLLPVGEDLPGQRWLPPSRNPERVSAGSFIDPLLLGSNAIGVTICYEDIHPRFVNRTGRSSALLVNLSNDGWFSGSPAAEFHFQLARLRAVEQRRFFVRASNTGVSAVVDPVGRVVASLPPDVAASIRAEVRWVGVQTLYGQIGDAPWLACAAVILVAQFVRRRFTVAVRRP